MRCILFKILVVYSLSLLIAGVPFVWKIIH
jgi:hypothetical protein